MAEWLFDQLSLESPGFWLLLSAVALPAVYVLSWRVEPRLRPWIAAARWVLIPYTGLMLGGLSPRLMGLSKINWLNTLSLGVMVLFGVLAAAAVIRIAMLLEQSDGHPGLAGPSGTLRPRRWSAVLLATLWLGAEQFHWCFVRGALWEILLTWPYATEAVPGYRAMWLATLLLLPEIWLQPADLARHLVKATLAVVTTVAFFYTRNFWLCWIIYAALWLLLASAGASLQQASSDVAAASTQLPARGQEKT